MEKKRTSRSRALNDQEEIVVWEKVCRELGKVEQIRKEGGGIFSQINSLHKLVDDEGVASSINYSLQKLYTEGKENLTKEQKVISAALEHLEILIALRDAPTEMDNAKRKKRKAEGEITGPVSNVKRPSSFKVQFENGIIPKRSYVAAKTPRIKDKSQEWILAVVLQYFPEKNKYQVEDADVDENGKRMRYNLPPRNIIPLPEEAILNEYPEFDIDHVVLALYPNTTCFYKAIVVLPPSKVQPNWSQRFTLILMGYLGQRQVIPGKLLRKLRRR
ncbi:DUF1325-domain-containing protein [Basidiobolus meristosporus CBS 931.73]|uniref:DUF1325-domain-containing protein n=1 Tax=Basidiobolus meristosporus CBS 931.73 TaxID=1314790 RepID=A0A1Y1Z7Z0_9FUNG|nr:DUF1325-domain-containing protein [Basidiobolus meristosporus CBS 931.73]|eukprot:ORY06117.1 DUF1325-domain-containing protein [Basidiobolus meristosporus CBS 931.73]